MDWTLLIDFIRQRDPDFLTAVEGVPDDELAALLAEAGVRLPASYLAFLRQMGVDSNGYHPFGATLEHDLGALVERLDENDEDEGHAPPPDRFFPVALETDESLETLQDCYLDLQRVDGDDAALVWLEAGVPFAWQKPVDAAETFEERLVNSAFNRFQLRHCVERDVVALRGEKQPGEGRAALQQALALLQRAGFEPVLPVRGRVACLQADGLSVLARVNENYELLTMQLGGSERAAVKELADQLLASLPGARRPAGPRNLD